MGLRANARSVPGTIRQEVLIDGRHRLVTDQPASIGGTELGPSLTVDVDYDHESTPRRFQTVIRLGGDLSDFQLERLHKVAAACPVRRSIETGIEFAERIETRRKAA